MMLRSHDSRSLAVALLNAVMIAGSLAALPPSAYRGDQESAPEALVIQVLAVKSEVSTDSQQTVTTVNAKARVSEVVRTASGLKPGDEIAIAYTNVEFKRDERRVGPSSYIPVLVEGKTVPAFLSTNGKGSYLPAARVYSFQEIR